MLMQNISVVDLCMMQEVVSQNRRKIEDKKTCCKR